MATRINQMEPWISEEEKRALVEYLDSGPWLTEFKQTARFEQMIAEYVGSRHCVVLMNGTVTLFAALVALGVGPGDEVIIPDFTMIASANAVRLAGAEPVFVDIEQTTLCLALDKTEQAITDRTKALMLVSLNGRAPAMDRVMALAKRHNLALVEDAAQSLGSRQGGKHLGTFGAIGSFSFSAPKVITTGQGGAVVTDDEVLAKRVRHIKDFGRARGGVDFHETVGYNFKFTDLQAVIGIEQMKKLPFRVERKKAIFQLYRDLLADVPQVEFVPTDLTQTSPWFIDVLVPDPAGLSAHLQSADIGTRPVYPAIHSQPAYGREGSYPVSEYVAAHGLWLPSSSFLTDDDVDRVCNSIRAYYAAQPVSDGIPVRA